VDNFEATLDRARVLMQYLPAFGEVSAMAELINSGIDPSIAFFAVRGSQVLEIQLNQKK